jgi:type II secretory pathway pseudopilin PulG
VLLGILVVFGMLAAVTVIAIYRWFQSPEVQERVGAAKDVMSMTMKAMNAPGTAELRAIGCFQAAIFDAEQADQYLGSIGRLTDEGAEEVRLPLVLCTAEKDRTVPCDRVAATYGGAGPAGDSALVMVQSTGFPQKIQCAGVYAKDGSIIEPIDPKTLQ